METPVSVLAWRVAELERIIGGRTLLTADDREKPEMKLLDALKEVAHQIRVAFGDHAAQTSENRSMNALHRASVLCARGYDVDSVLKKCAMPETRSTALEVVNGVEELVALEQVLDQPWPRTTVLGNDVFDALAKARRSADDAELQLTEETRAVDRLIVSYNAEVSRMNFYFEQLVEAVHRLQTCESKSG